MPTSPQGIICFYAANKLGAVSSMIHPLSTIKEIEFYLNVAKSRFVLTLDAFYGKFKDLKETTPLETLILARIPDYLGPLKRIGFNLTMGRKIPKVPPDPMVKWWKDLMRGSYPHAPQAQMDTDELAVILYSGGTTGVPKGIMLSNMNFISEGLQVSEWGRLSGADSILAILPIFHGFGLGVCVNACFMGGGKSILVPQFTPETVAQIISSKKPSFVIGVPTLFDALSRHPKMHKTNLSCLHGLTEAVTAIMAMPIGHYREGSIGIPFPDMLAKIVRLNTTDEVPCGEEGEICISGPAVMLGYLDQPEETANTLRQHPDGKLWLHTGDIGTMDEDGFFYFKLRQKRMIKSSGMNVYPAQVEDILYKHPDIRDACIIGVPDEAQVQLVKGIVVLKDPAKASPEMEKILIDFCRDHLIKWSCPREIEFRDSLPKTLVGKIAFNVLEEEEIAKLKAAGKFSGN